MCSKVENPLFKLSEHLPLGKRRVGECGFNRRRVGR